MTPLGQGWGCVYKAEDAHTQLNNPEAPAKFTGIGMLCLAVIHINIWYIYHA